MSMYVYVCLWYVYRYVCLDIYDVYDIDVDVMIDIDIDIDR